ncbi:MAG TPA: hypothetical protein VHV81_09265, partial [Steroidobacteraceae bacterium]|nr:hypothetical protein [Steroidobacteraceae bacterium]
MFLLLANVGYFLWERGIGSPEQAPAAGPAVGTLKLASEVPDAARPGDAASAARDKGAGAPAGITSASADRSAASDAGGSAAGAGGDSAGDPKQPLLTGVKRCITVGPFRD